MFNYIWPILLIVVSNTAYQICAKSAPEKADPFASLVVTYLVSALSSVLLYFAFNRQGSLLKEFTKLNWAPFVFGLVLVGLEVGWIYAYKAGWPVSTAAIVQSSLLALLLILVGYFLFKEAITWNKIVGVLICLVGLVFINLKA